MQTDLQASIADLQWVVGGYALAFASIMLACGMIGDELGRKKVMLAGAGVFCAGSVLCALAPNAQTLIAGRVIMGLGAAASEPGTLSILRQIYTDDRARARAVGVWAAVSGLALAIGPVIGGALIGLWSWRAIFWFNLFFGLAALIVAAIVVPESSDHRQLRVDTVGTVLGAGALATLLFAIIDSETSSFARPLVIALLCAAFVLAVAFVLWERRTPNPLLDMRLFRSVWFTVPNAVAFCTYFATFAIFFFTALYLDEVVHASGYRIALAFAPMTVLMIIASVAAGYWTARAGARLPIVVGCAAFAAGLLLANPLITTHPNYPLLSLALALAGIGIGITVVPVTATVLNAVVPERSGMAASATNTSREVGAVTGVAILGALVFSQLNSSLTSEPAGAERPRRREGRDPRLQVDDHLVHRDRPGADQLLLLRPDRGQGDQRRLRVLRRRTARRALPVGRPRHRGRPARRGHAARPPARSSKIDCRRGRATRVVNLVGPDKGRCPN